MLLLNLGLNSDQKKKERELHTKPSTCAMLMAFDGNVAFLHNITVGMVEVSQRKRDGVMNMYLQQLFCALH